MKRLFTNGLVAVLIAVLVSACGGTATSSGPGATTGAEGVAGLIAQLRAGGTTIDERGTFAPDPLPGRGVLLCLGTEPVRVYEFNSTAERAAVASRIQPDDPSRIGTAIVEWSGRPRFWQRDRILVLYLGESAPTEALLNAALGPPFAKGTGRAPLQVRDCA